MVAVTVPLMDGREETVTVVEDRLTCWVET